MLAYEIFLTVGALLCWPLFLLSKRGRIGILERFGFWKLQFECRQSPHLIWFHAASIGEVNGIAAIIQQVSLAQPMDKILVTCTSVTGCNRARQLGYISFLAPFDARWFYKLAFRSLLLRAIIVSETEIWPGMLGFARSRSVPVIWVNAFMRASNLRFYKSLSFLFPTTLASINFVAAGSSKAKNLFQELGIAEHKIKVLGNAKFDLAPSLVDSDSISQLAKNLFVKNRPLIAFGSIRPGEEQICFQSIKILMEMDLDFQVIIAPRHAERFNYFAQQLERHQLKFVRRSMGIPSNERILLLDCIGELEPIYSLAHVAFIGGTITSHGGHSPVEPASYAVPIICGPHYEAIEEFVSEVIELAGAQVVRNAEQLTSALRLLLLNPDKHQLSKKAIFTVYNRHLGSATRIATELQAFLGGS